MLKELAPYLSHQKRDICLSALCSAAESLFALLIPLVMASIIDKGIKNSDLQYTLKMGGLMAVMALGVVAAGVFSMKFATRAGLALGTELRSETYRKLQSFTFRNIEKFGTSSLITRLTTDVSTIQNTTIQAVKYMVRTPSMLIFSVVFSFIICPRLAWMFLALTPLVALVIVLIILKIRPLYQKMQQRIDNLNLATQENLIAMRLVKAFVRKQQQKERFGKDNKAVFETTDKAMGLSVLTTPLGNLILYGAMILLYWFGGRLIMGGELSVGQLTSLSTYMSEILQRIMLLASISILISRSGVSLRRIFEVIKTEPDITDGPGHGVPADGSVAFENVSFRYDEGELLLDGLNLVIPSGQTVGILGGTGSAKTTLVSLIPRLYDICGGSIRVGGGDIQDYTLKSLREAVSIVLQQNTLFSGTVRENLLWGNPAATQSEIEHACRAACADEFIEGLENGYDAILGQGGVNLSGGQRQRLCIARALLKSPKILILDDSTSAVDMATDAAIRKAFRAELPGVTKLIIAQRVSSVSDADRILILSEGRIVGDGTHSELLEGCEIYRELCQLQHVSEGGVVCA